MGVIRASFQSTGTDQLSKDFWKIRVIAGASSSAARERSLVGMPSGPQALCGFRFFSMVLTPGVDIVIASMVGMTLGPRSGTLVRSSRVNTE